MAHPVTWFQISGKDGSALQKFYEEVFGWRMSLAPDGSMMMVEAEEGGIAGGIGTSRDGTSSVSIYVNADDVAEQLKKIQDAGGGVAMPPMELPAGMGWIAGFTDPAGNWVGLWQPGKQATAAPAKKKVSKKAPAKKKAAKAPAKAAAKKPPARAMKKPARAAKKKAPAKKR